MGFTQKIQTYLTSADTILTMAGAALIGLEASTGQVPWIGFAVGGCAVALRVVKYAEKQIENPETTSLIADLQARIKALEDYAKPTNQVTPQ